MIRRMVLVFLTGAAVCLLPWTVYLAHTLPDRYDTCQWRAAWVGFDIALLLCFAAAAWLGLRPHRSGCGRESGRCPHWSGAVARRIATPPCGSR